MKFEESIIQAYVEEEKKKIPSTIYVQPQAFAQMWTQNGANRRISNPTLIQRIGEEWQSIVGGQISIQDQRVLIDTRTVRQIDPETKQINELEGQDLLSLEVSQIAVGRAIITLYAKGLNPDFFPTLAIVLTEQGEKFCFGETVSVCTNFTVFNSGYFIDTTSKSASTGKKHTTEEAIKIFKEGVFKKTQETFELDIQEIEQLKQKHISQKEFLAFMGEQHRLIEVANSFRLNHRLGKLSKDEKNLALNSRQLAKIAVESFAPSHPEYEWENDSTTAWKVINFGTEQIKAERGSDIPTLIESNLRWVDKVRNYEFNFCN